MYSGVCEHSVAAHITRSRALSPMYLEPHWIGTYRVGGSHGRALSASGTAVIYGSAMPSVRVSEHSELPPGAVLAAARDFTDRRADMWPDVHVEYLQVHETGESHAEVTEGNPWPIGYVWERLRYDWSDPRALRGEVIDSNLFKPGSTWELWATPEDGGSRVEIRAVRHLRGRGWLLAPFFLPIPVISAAATVRQHLRHFLDSVEASDH